MKRLICFCLLFMLFLTGCNSPSEEYIEPVNFYFLKADVTYFTDDGVICREQREAHGYRQDYEQLLRSYLLGPGTAEMRRVFPKNVELVRLELSETGAVVTLNDAVARLTGLDLTIACACLTATVCDMTGVKTVTLRAETQLLDGNKSITMTRDHILLLDSSVAAIGN